MDPALLRLLKSKHKERTGTDYWRYTFPEWSSGQLAFLESPAKKLLLRGPRRAGKTQALAERMLKVTNTPVTLPDGSVIYGSYAYITQTRELAKSIMWKELKEMCKKRGLTYTSNEVDLRMVFPNGGSIELQGAGLQDSANKARGRKMVGVAVDEAAFINALKEIVEIWTPTLADYTGELVLSCSPGKTPTGYFYSCDQGELAVHWDKHYLNPAENPAFKGDKYETFRQEQLRTLYGGNDQHPVYRREWLGEWVHDISNLLIKYNPQYNLYDDLHRKNTDLYDYIIGLDLGYLDSTAISVLAVAKYEPEAIFVDEFTQPELRISEIIEKVEFYSKKWDASTVVVDSGGFGKHTFVELQNREGLPVIDKAQKYGKKLNIETMNNELYAKRLKVSVNCSQIIAAWTKVLKNDKGTEDENVDYGDAGILDILDSTLYAVMEAHPSVYEKLQPQESEESKMKRKHLEKHQKKQRLLNEMGMKGFFE